MKAASGLWLGIAAAALACGGCVFVPKSKLTAAETQNRALAEQGRAQLTEIENLKVHSRTMEDKLLRAEQQLAFLQERVGLDGEQLENYQQLDQQLQGLAGGPWRMAPAVARRLEELAKKYPNLHFDPTTGISKVDTDVLFDSGQAELKPQAMELLAELAQLLNSAEAQDLKIMVAGHTDDELIAKKPARDVFPNNYHLSAARALAVTDFLRERGVAGPRIAASLYGPDQPIAPNGTPRDRQKNRRVEIFVMAREVPIVGQTDSLPSVY